jgi:biopolymer transport protein ExbB
LKGSLFEPCHQQYKKTFGNVEEALENGGIEAAKDVCRNQGTSCQIFFQGLDRADHGIELLKNQSFHTGGTGWFTRKRIKLDPFYCSCPMLGFMGTVIG